MKKTFGLNKKEYSFLKRLNTPNKIQDYLDSIPFNFEKNKESCMSPKKVLGKKIAHCMEGVIFACACFYLNGHKPLVLNFKVARGDIDHAIALYKINGYWGAISKTNHAVLRFRDPVYKNIRELVMSYFNEYYLTKTGKKTLKGYTVTNLLKYGKKWISREDDLWDISGDIYDMKYIPIIPKSNQKFIRKASLVERKTDSITEWNK